MSVPKSARHTAGQIKESGANAAGATETSTQSGGISYLDNSASTCEFDAIIPATLVDRTATRRVRPQDLSPHPVSREIYGEDDGADLVVSIIEHDVLEPLLVTLDNVVISGHRRLAACLKAGVPTVPVLSVDPVDDAAIIDLLLAANAQRIKTNEQLAREAAYRMKIEQEKARRRQADAGVNKLPAKSPEAGDARVIVAKQMGFGPKWVDQCVKVVEKLNELQADGDDENHAAISLALEKSVNRACNKALVLDERAKHQVQRRTAANDMTEDAAEDGVEDNAAIMARIQDDLVDGMESWPIETLLEFEIALTAFRVNWVATNGEEAA